jgi:porphobilinogen deaminase
MALKLRIGSRPSQLAMGQANFIKDRLEQTLESLSVEIVSIKSSGDSRKLFVNSSNRRQTPAESLHER